MAGTNTTLLNLMLPPLHAPDGSAEGVPRCAPCTKRLDFEIQGPGALSRELISPQVSVESPSPSLFCNVLLDTIFVGTLTELEQTMCALCPRQPVTTPMLPAQFVQGLWLFQVAPSPLEGSSRSAWTKVLFKRRRVCPHSDLL